MTSASKKRRASLRSGPRAVPLHPPPPFDSASGAAPAALPWLLLGGYLAALLFTTFGPHVIGDYFTETDFYGGYALGASAIRHGHFDPARYGVVGPVFDLLLAAVTLTGSDAFIAAQLISIAATVSILLLTHDLVRRRLGPWPALCALAIGVTNPHLFRYGYSATTDALNVAWQALTLWFVLGRSSLLAAAAGGLFAGVAVLTRYNSVYLFPAALLAIAIGATQFRARWRAALHFSAGFFLPVLVWMGFFLTRRMLPGAPLYHDIAYAIYAYAHGIPWDAYETTMGPRFKSMRDVLAYEPRALLVTLLQNIPAYVAKDCGVLLGWLVAGLGGVGLARAARDPQARWLWAIAAAGALLFLTLLPVRYSERYSLGLVPLAAMAAGLPLAQLLAPTRPAPWWRRVAGVAVTGAVLVVGLVASVRLQLAVIRQLPREVLSAARVLAALERPGDRLLARKPHLAYLTRARFTPLPHDTSLAQLAAYAHSTNTRWLYVSWIEVELRPLLLPLLDTTGTTVGLVPRCVTSDAASVLYEITPEFGAPSPWQRDVFLRTLKTTRAHLSIHINNRHDLAVVTAMELIRGNWPEAQRAADRLARRDPQYLSIATALSARDSSAALSMLGAVLGVPKGQSP